MSSPAAGCASRLDRLGFGVLVGCTARSTWLSVPPAPSSFYMVPGDGGPLAIWAGRPRSWHVCEGKARLRSVGGPGQQEIKLTAHTYGAGDLVLGRRLRRHGMAVGRVQRHCSLAADSKGTRRRGGGGRGMPRTAEGNDRMGRGGELPSAVADGKWGRPEFGTVEGINPGDLHG
jgi:hypothetical protein